MKAMIDFNRMSQQQVCLAARPKDRHHKVPHKAMGLPLKSITRRETLDRAEKAKQKQSVAYQIVCFFQAAFNDRNHRVRWA